MLSNAKSKTCSVNWLGIRLRVLEILDIVAPLVLESTLIGRERVFSHGHTTFSLSVGDTGSVGLELRSGIYGSYSMPSNCACSSLKILYSMLIGVSAVNGFTSVKKMSEASVCISRLCGVVMLYVDVHFFLKLRTSRRNMVFSAVNSRDAVHSINGSMLCSMHDSSACIPALGLNSLVDIDFDSFSELSEEAERRDTMSVEMNGTARWFLAASRSGTNMRTC